MKGRLLIRKALLFALVTTVALGALIAPADAKKKKKKGPKKVERTIEHDYNLGYTGVPGVGGTCLGSVYEGSACFETELGASEIFVTVKVEDASGSAPYVALSQDTDTSTPSYEIFTNFCGESPGPIPITPGIPLRVSAYAAPSPDCDGGGATTGTITMTLSNLP